MLFDMLPVHISYMAKDRRPSAWFFQNVLGLKVIRHEEFKLPTSTSCVTPLSDQWCKTSFAFGPPPAHFAVQQVYSYKGFEDLPNGNDFVGAKIKSLEAMARAKAIGVQGYDDPDGSFHIPGMRNCHGYWLFDHHKHNDCDPYAGEVLRVTDLKETLNYWHRFLGADIIDLQSNQFSLFFSNGYPILTFQQSTIPLVLSPAHLGFTMPRDQLKEMSSLMLRSGMAVHQPYNKVENTGRNSDYLVILKDPTGYFLYFYDVESFSTLSKYDPKAEARFSISLIKERDEMNRRARFDSEDNQSNQIKKNIVRSSTSS